ncbi:MAG: GntR family transcriptional regulator [Planctomycetota bacterium]
MLEGLELPRVSFRKGISKYTQVQRQIREMINDGTLKPNTRLPSETRIAKELAVSVSTIRQALEGLRQDGLLDRIHGSGTFVRSCQGGKLSGSSVNSSLIACVVGDMRWVEKVPYPAMVEIFRGVHRVVDNSNYTFSITGLDKRNTNFVDDYILGIFAPGTVAGLLVSAQELANSEIERLSETGVPTVVCNRFSHLPSLLSVRVNICEGVFEAVDYLIRLGHKRIALLNSRSTYPLGMEILVGLRTALQKHGIGFDPEYVRDVGYNADLALSAMRELLNVDRERRPTAALLADDVLARRIVNEVEKDGLKVPDDLSVIGCTELPEAGPTSKCLSTIYVPLEEMGRCGAQMLIDELTGKGVENRSVILPVEFHPGETTAEPSQGS